MKLMNDKLTAIKCQNNPKHNPEDGNTKPAAHDFFPFGALRSKSL